MSLVEDTAVKDATQTPSLQNECELDDYQRLILKNLLQDFDHRPILKALRRDGTYTFWVILENVTVTMTQTRELAKRHIRKSHLTLDAKESYCSLELLERVVRIACRKAGIRFDGIIQGNEGSAVRYAITVTYNAPQELIA